VQVFTAVRGEQKRERPRLHRLGTGKIMPDEFSYRAFGRFARRDAPNTVRTARGPEQLELRSRTGTVDAFQHDEVR
jgi:hypothetical protein